MLCATASQSTHSCSTLSLSSRIAGIAKTSQNSLPSHIAAATTSNTRSRLHPPSSSSSNSSSLRRTMQPLLPPHPQQQQPPLEPPRPFRTCTFTTAAAAAAAADGSHGAADRPVKTRRVVDHLCLFDMHPDMAQTEEDDMLSHLYTLQYHYPHVLAISLGRITNSATNAPDASDARGASTAAADSAPAAYTHALVARFASEQTLQGFVNHPALAAVTDNYVKPQCRDSLSLSFACEVQDDIEMVFRRGELFDCGIEHLLLLRVPPSAPLEQQQQMLEAMAAMPESMGGGGLVQLTAGSALFADPDSFLLSVDPAKGFTHALVARFNNADDLDSYNKHPSYREVLRRHVLPLAESILTVDYRVDPVGE